LLQNNAIFPPIILLYSFLCACTVSEKDMSATNTPSSIPATVLPSSPETISIQLKQEQSPLKDAEITKDELPEWLQTELRNSERAVAVGNLLRAPCSQEWYEGITLNQSLQQGKCRKSKDWIQAIDAKISKGTSVEDILFTMVAPGPYYSTEQNINAMVIISIEHLETVLFIERFEVLSSLESGVKVFVVGNGVKIIDSKCIENGHIVTDKLENMNCIGNIVEEDKQFVDGVIANTQLPIWLINGYRLSGFQSISQITRTLSLP